MDFFWTMFRLFLNFDQIFFLDFQPLTSTATEYPWPFVAFHGCPKIHIQEFPYPLPMTISCFSCLPLKILKSKIKDQNSQIWRQVQDSFWIISAIWSKSINLDQIQNSGPCFHCDQLRRGPLNFKKGNKRGPNFEQKGDQRVSWPDGKGTNWLQLFNVK